MKKVLSEIKEYLLDSNIIIKLWNENIDFFEKIQNQNKFTIKITTDIMQELAVKENLFCDNRPVFTRPFLFLIKYCIHNSNFADGREKDNRFYKLDENKVPHIIICNNVSAVDRSLIIYCQNNKKIILVTNDNKLKNTGEKILGADRIKNYDEFIKEINKIF